MGLWNSYSPLRPEGTNLPTLLYFHARGGGSVDAVEKIDRSPADRAGHIVINVAYHLVPKHRFPAGLKDCSAAVEWAAESGCDFGGADRNFKALPPWPSQA